MPPLREHSSDIPLLVDHFLEQFTKESGKPRKEVSCELLEALTQYRWPGNVRHLRNVLERMYFLSSGAKLELGDLPAEIAVPEEVDSKEGIAPMWKVEREHIAKVLKATGGNKSQASKLLGIDRKTLHAKIKSYSIS